MPNDRNVVNAPLRWRPDQFIPAGVQAEIDALGARPLPNAAYRRFVAAQAAQQAAQPLQEPPLGYFSFSPINTLRKPKCKKCKRRNKNCPICGERCSFCCVCTVFCQSCRISHSSHKLCRKCSHCKRYCVCKAKGIMTKTTKNFANTLTRPLGVELEVAVLGSLSTYGCLDLQFWHWEHDGTITPGGQELVGKPAGGDLFIKKISELISAISRADPPPKVDQSCGFHVHVQAFDLGWWELRRLVRIWGGIETDIFTHLCEPSRRNNRYCMPLAITGDTERREAWQFSPNNLSAMMRSKRRKIRYNLSEEIILNTTSRIKRFLINKLYGIDVGSRKPMTPEERQSYLLQIGKFNNAKKNKRTSGDLQNGAGMGCRYGALNLHSYFFRHTIEFRLKEGTLDPTELLYWPLFCGWIVESAARLKDTETTSITSLHSWLALMRVKQFVQPSVLDWVEERLKKS